jgi:uncharacterized protein (TIGR03083 family)
MTADDREHAALPAGLRDRVLAASLGARAAGRPVPDLAPITPVEAYSRAADAFYGLLCALAEEAWRRPVLRDLDVQGLVGHLAGVEHDVQRSMAGDPEVADANHITSTQAAADRQAGRSVTRTRAEWRAAADRTLALVESAPALTADVAMHGMRLTLGALLVVRAFELWTHENDIRRAVNLPESVPDVATLRLMTDLAARVLPAAATRTGLAGPVDVHLVLTGEGGGTWDLAVGNGPAGDGPASLSIVTDAVGFCRLVANRTTPADLELHITGDRDRAASLLAAASALALD